MRGYPLPLWETFTPQMWIHIDIKTKKTNVGIKLLYPFCQKRKGIKFRDLHVFVRPLSANPNSKGLALPTHHLVPCLAADGGAMGMPCRPDCGGGGTPDIIGTRKGTQTY